MFTVKECSERATACERLAGQAKDSVIERWYHSLVKTWRVVAEISESRDRNEWRAVVRSIQSGNDNAK
jgi:hypothetical protein